MSDTDEEPLIVGSRRDRRNNDTQPEGGEAVTGAYEVYGAQDYVGAALDNLWKILEPGGHLSMDIGTNSTAEKITIAMSKRMGIDLPTKIRMLWSREGELLRIKFVDQKIAGWFKFLFRPQVQISEITVTKEEAVIALSGVLADYFIPDQKIVFKEGTPA